jgi:N-acetyl sugar amidotransferase
MITQKIRTGRWGLPLDVRFCKKCVISNQRPSSVVEWLKHPESLQPTIHFDEEGVCDACRLAERKHREIDWKQREEELHELLAHYRSKNGSYDCIVPGSGGKDSVYASHILKTKYGMHPLTVTWAPHIYTEVGWRNFQRWIHAGFDNILFTPNGQVHRKLTQLAFVNLCHPFQPFVIGQKNVGPKLAARFGIPLVIYGENESEYGNAIQDTTTASRDRSYFSRSGSERIYLGGVPVEDLPEHGINLEDLEAYLPPPKDELDAVGVDVRYLGYYLKWIPQECYYYAVEHADFEANPDGRTEGTYSKYNSIDDRIDGFHYYTTYVKFGIGRATYDAAQEIRSGHLTREEGVALVHRFDGEFPKKYFREVLEYMDLTEEQFWAIIDSFRPEHLWEKVNGEWKLKHRVS